MRPSCWVAAVLTSSFQPLHPDMLKAQRPAPRAPHSVAQAQGSPVMRDSGSRTSRPRIRPWAPGRPTPRAAFPAAGAAARAPSCPEAETQRWGASPPTHPPQAPSLRTPLARETAHWKLRPTRERATAPSAPPGGPAAGKQGGWRGTGLGASEPHSDEQNPKGHRAFQKTML